MSRRHIAMLLLGLAALPGCLTTGDKGLMAQKPREPATLPPEETAVVCLEVADKMAMTGNFKESVCQLNQARAANPKVDVSSRLARLYAKMDQEELALIEFDRATKAAPKDAALWNDLGYFHYERGRWTDAEKNYRKALEFAGDTNQKVWLNLGLALGQQSRYPESLAAFEKAVRPAEARCNLAFVLGTQGKHDEAKKLYEEALRLEPNLKLARQAMSKLDRPAAKPVQAKAAGPVVQVSAAAATRTTLAPQAPQATARPAPGTFEYPEP